MSTISIKKDAYQILAQNQLGRGISALGSVLTELINNKTPTDKEEKQIAILSDIGILLTDLFHTMSTSRRFFIASGFDISEKAIAAENKIDEYLFGKDFSEKVKWKWKHLFKLSGPLQEEYHEHDSTGGGEKYKIQHQQNFNR